MGVYSTLCVSRKAAMAKVAEHLFGGWSNEQLEEALEDRFSGRLYNFSVGHGGHDDEQLERL